MLPRDRSGKPGWGPYQECPADAETVRGWFQRGCQSIAAIGGKVSGGLLIIDFDEARFYDAWREQVGSLANGLPVQRTGRDGGGYQVWLRCPEPGRNDKLAYVPDEIEGSGRRAAIETRAEAGYAVLPGSLHPSGRRYEVLEGDFANVPTVAQAVVDAILAAARKLDEAPATRQQAEAKENAASDSIKYRDGSNGQGSVIDTYNRQVGIEESLRAHGYAAKGQRFVRPGGRNPSITVRDGRSFHHHSSDPLSDGYWHRPFDLYCQYEHGGDCRTAVKAAAAVLGLKPTPAREPTAKREKHRGTADINTEWKPFPTAVLPEQIAHYVEAAAESIGCDPALVGVPLLSALAAAIGTSTRIQLKPDWHEPAIIWSAIVGDSGTHKSPAMKAATQFSNAEDAWEIQVFKEAYKAYEEDSETYEKEMKEWKRKPSGLPPEKPVLPVCRRFLVADITVEALIDRLVDNPRGVLVARDELAGWLDGFNQYKGGKGADSAAWLTIHNAGSLRSDRRGKEHRTVFVQSAAVSITGGIQPPVLARSLGASHFQDGMAARLLVAMPPKLPRKWTDKRIPPEAIEGMRQIFQRLWSLEIRTDDDGSVRSLNLPLTPEGQNVWVSFYDAHGEELTAMTGDLASAWSKLEGYAARLALVCHLAEWAAGNDGTPGPVDQLSVEAGIAMVDWFKNETRRVYAVLGESDEAREVRELVDLIRRRGGTATPRDLMRATRKYRGSMEDAEAALDRLARGGVGAWETQPPGKQGGRPTRVFRLREAGTGDRTPEFSEKIEVVVPWPSARTGPKDATGANVGNHVAIRAGTRIIGDPDARALFLATWGKNPAKRNPGATPGFPQPNAQKVTRRNSLLHRAL